MNYVLNRDALPLKERICAVTGIDTSALDVSDFRADHDIPVLKHFRERLLSLKDKRFFIVGDYDCDGICATAIMKKLFDDLSVKNNYYIPSRSRDGYGINERIVDTAIENGFDVLLCVDNGIVANAELQKAKDAGIITLVIDHHEYSETPLADEYLHPDLFPSEYEDMCAGGLCALLSSSIREDILSEVLGGLATLADMVRVFGYNRYLMKRMLKLLKEESIDPIRYLLGSSETTYENLSFNVIPKINAISRMENRMNVNHMVRFLLDYDNEAIRYLSTIEGINRERKDLTRSMAELSERLMDHDEDVIVIRSDTFTEGLCGLVANRLMFEHERPVIILSENEGILKGSGRSPAGSNLYDYLQGISDIFTAFGGHAQAVGLTLRAEDYPKLTEYVQNSHFSCETPAKNVLVFDQDDIDGSLIDELDEMRPFGTGFEEPLIGIEEPRIEKRYLISRMYPKFVLNDGLEAICFDRKLSDVPFSMMIGRLRRDERHQNALSLVIEDLRQF